jgi:MurNAc alpha-1-phosphate uridylyltransferase
MTKIITQAMVMAAGMGTRMRPLTNDIAKPMIEVNGMSLIEFTLLKLHQADIEKIVINLHYKADLLKEFILNLSISKKFEIIFSYEQEPLEAGGIVKALPYFNDDLFFIVNSDTIWFEDDNKSFLKQMANNFDENKMDLFISLQPTNNAFGHDGNGDFNITENNQIIYNGSNCSHNYIFSGLRITNKELFAKQPVAKFHFFKDFLYKNRLKNDCILDRVFGIVHKGDWLDIGNLEGFKIAEQYFEKRSISAS